MTQPDMSFKKEDFLESCRNHVVNERWVDFVVAVANAKIQEWTRCEKNKGGQHDLIIGANDNLPWCIACGRPLIVIAARD